MSTEKKWWNSLRKQWKVTLINNLKDCTDNKHNNVEEIEWFNQSEFQIKDILALEKLSIPVDLVLDLSPVFELKDLNDFYIIPNSPSEDFIFLYPKQLRDKVKTLGFFEPGYGIDNLRYLNDFVNLENLYLQYCHINSLSGIEKLKKLKKVAIDQGNNYSDLTPLKKLKLTELDISFTNVSNLAPLANIETLESITMEGITIKSIAPLFTLHNLKNIELYYTYFEDNNQIIDEIEHAFSKHVLDENSELGLIFKEIKNYVMNN